MMGVVVGSSDWRAVGGASPARTRSATGKAAAPYRRCPRGYQRIYQIPEAAAGLKPCPDLPALVLDLPAEPSVCGRAKPVDPRLEIRVGPGD
jgi:hypothetical protein